MQENTQEEKVDKRIITDEEKELYEKKCIELAAQHKCSKVHVFVAIKANDPECERVVAYIKEPDYINKLALIDKAVAMGSRQAAEELRMLYQITEESHPLTYGEHSECDRYKLGVAEFCIGLIQISVDVLKKK